MLLKKPITIAVTLFSSLFAKGVSAAAIDLETRATATGIDDNKYGESSLNYVPSGHCDGLCDIAATLDYRDTDKPPCPERLSWLTPLAKFFGMCE